MGQYLKLPKTEKTINTQGLCFFCLKSETSNGIFTLRSLFQFLQIEEAVIITEGNGFQGLLREAVNANDISVFLCNSCEVIANRLMTLIQKLEEIQMEINYSLGRISQKIVKSLNCPLLMETYRRKMESRDGEVLSKMVLINNFRKEVANNCLMKQTSLPRPFVKLTRTNLTEKVFEETEEIIETVDFEDSAQTGYSPFSNQTYFDPERSHPSPEMVPLPLEDVKVSPSTLNARKELFQTKTTQMSKQFQGRYSIRNAITGLYECTKCEKTLKSTKNIVAHYKAMHLKQRFKCGTCEASFSTSTYLKVHRKICQEKLKKRKALEFNPNFKFVCNIYQNRFDTIQKCNAHKRQTHENSNRYPCDLCDKKFKQLWNLQEHKNSVHLLIKISCRYCKKTYRSRSTFMKHEKTCQKNVEDKQF